MKRIHIRRVERDGIIKSVLLYIYQINGIIFIMNNEMIWMIHIMIEQQDHNTDEIDKEQIQSVH